MKTPRKAPRIFYGWWVVAASGFVSLYTAGTFFYGFTAYFNPIIEEFGWSRSATSAAFSLYRLEGGLAAPVVGVLTDKLGVRKLMMGGAFVFGLGFLLLSQINELWQFYAAMTVIALGMTTAGILLGFVAVANWFVRRRSRAMSILALGGGLSGVLVSLISLSIEQFGWRPTLIMTGLGAWLIALPCAALVRTKPEPYGLRPDGDPAEPDEAAGAGTNRSGSAGSQNATNEFSARQAMRSRTFWLMCVAVALAALAENAVVVHQIPLMRSMGISTAMAALVASGSNLCSLIGRMGVAMLGDRIEKRYGLALCYVMTAAGIVALLYASDWVLIAVFLLLYGSAAGAVIPLRPSTQADYFGRGSFATIQGLMATMRTAGTMIGPVFAGLMFDISGSYYWAFMFLALTSLASAPIIMALGAPRAPKAAAVTT